MILIVSNTVRVLLSVALLASVFLPASDALPIIFGVAIMLGCVNAFTPAAANSLFPRLVPRRELPNAIAWNSLGFQTAVIVGPAVGGLIYGFFGAATVYTIAILLAAFAILAIATAKTPPHEKVLNVRGWSMVFEGLGYIRRNKIVLGAISLDLVVVFFGGAKATVNTTWPAAGRPDGVIIG